MLQASPESTFHQTVYAAPGRSGQRRGDLFVSLYGQFQSLGGFDNELISTAHNVHVIREGRGTALTSHGSYEIGAGEVLVFWPGEQVRYFDHRNAPWRYDWFFLEGSRVEQVMEQLGFSPREPHLRCPAAEKHLDSMAAAFRDCGHVELTWAIEAWKFVDVLLRSIPHPPSTRATPTGVAEACRRMIDTRHMNPLTIDRLARQLRVSRSTLFRRFVAAYGVSPKEYLDEVRLQRASVMLRGGEIGVKQTAYSCGFASPYYFSRAFTKRFGVCPSEWSIANSTRKA